MCSIHGEDADCDCRYNCELVHEGEITDYDIETDIHSCEGEALYDYECSMEEQYFMSEERVEDVIGNYWNFFFNPGFPYHCSQVIRHHSNRIEKVFWSKYYDFTADENHWVFKIVVNAALLEDKLAPVADQPLLPPF